MSQKLYINPMTGQQIIAETPPAGVWSCLGDAVSDSTMGATPQQNPFADVDMTAPDEVNE